jgi:hypothetical protein
VRDTADESRKGRIDDPAFFVSGWSELVMPGLVPGIHVFSRVEDVDGRDEPGHDVERVLRPPTGQGFWVPAFAGTTSIV